jgi:hypothetical protein
MRKLKNKNGGFCDPMIVPILLVAAVVVATVVWLIMI